MAHDGPLRLTGILCLAAALTGCASGGLSRRQRGSGAAIAKSARSQTGGKYKFAGASPEAGFDCSGLAWWSHKQNGILIPRMSFKQYGKGKSIAQKDLKPGDLLFFTTYKPGPSHVGIYQGGGKFIHAPKSGLPVRSDSMHAPYWKKRYLGARRYY